MKDVAEKGVSLPQTQVARITFDGNTGGTTLVWNPNAEPGETGRVGWDVLGGADSVIAADRISESLLSIIDDPPSLIRRPEAELLCADLLVAAARGGNQLDTVLDWVAARDLAAARGILAAAREEYPADDIDWFGQTSADEQDDVWQILARALDPLRDPWVLACLQPSADNTRLPGALSTLFTCDPSPIPQPRQLLVTVEPHTRGVAAALVDRLVWAGHEHGVRIDARPTSDHDDAQ